MDRFSKYRPHKLCLWVPEDELNEYGEEQYKDAVEIYGRWFEGRHEVTDTEGNRVIAEHSAFVDREVPVGSWLRKGGLDEIDSMADPHTLAGPLPEDAHPTIRFSSVWDFAGVIKFRTVSMT